VDLNTTDDESTVRPDDSTIDGGVETGVELTVNKAQCDGPSGESDADSMLANGGQCNSSPGEMDTDAGLTFSETQCGNQGDNSEETSAEMQVDASGAAPTPLAGMDSMHDVAPAVTASTDDAGGSIAQHHTPSWVTDARQYFLTIPAGEKWEKLIHHWMDIEKGLGYPDGSVSSVFNSMEI
jgi:hypothetical protein